MVFFFFALNLINLTHALMFRSQAVTIYSELELFFGALVVGKLLPILNLLPFVDLFRGRPLIFSTVWKGFVYSVGALIFRFCKFLMPFVHQYDGIAIGWRHMALELDWFLFWGVQLWIVTLLMVYVTARELIDAVGTARVRQLFFGR